MGGFWGKPYQPLWKLCVILRYLGVTVRADRTEAKRAPAAFSHSPVHRLQILSIYQSTHQYAPGPSHMCRLHHTLSIMEGQNHLDTSQSWCPCLSPRQLSPMMVASRLTASPQGATKSWVTHHLYRLSTSRWKKGGCNSYPSDFFKHFNIWKHAK